MQPAPPASQQLPIRRRLTVLRDGASSTACLVYCPSQERSVPLINCAMCGFGGRIARDAHGREDTVACARARAEAIEHARALPVGLAVQSAVVCLTYDVPVRTAARLFETEPSAFGMPVVDRDRRFLGLLSRASALLALDGAHRGVAGRMISTTPTIEERASLDLAFAAMAARRARELVVLDAAREVVGVLRDVDALRFVAYVSRTGRRPPRDVAA